MPLLIVGINIRQNKGGSFSITKNTVNKDKQKATIAMLLGLSFLIYLLIEIVGICLKVGLNSYCTPPANIITPGILLPAIAYTSFRVYWLYRKPKSTTNS